jgi:hypothetical protein
MKIVRSSIAMRSGLLALGLLITVSAVMAERLLPNYDMSWFTVDQGGGTASGSGFELSGTVGQLDSGAVMTGGGYSFATGYWQGVQSNDRYTVDIDFPGVSTTNCLTFEFYTCPNALPVVVKQEVSFSAGQSFGAVVMAPSNLGPYTCVRVRDPLHSLNAMLDLSSLAVGAPVSFTGIHALRGGNLNADNVIDILDFGIFVGRYNTHPSPAACDTVGPHADIDGDGVVFVGDFSFIQQNFLNAGDAPCCGSGFAGDAGPLARISVDELWNRGLGQLTVGDLNYDGWLDQADMSALLAGAVPQPLIVFNSATQGTWFDDHNWASDQMPDAHILAVVPEQSRAMVDRAGAEAQSVTVRAHATLAMMNQGTLASLAMTVLADGALELNVGSAVSLNMLTLKAGSALVWNNGVLQVGGRTIRLNDFNRIARGDGSPAFAPIYRGATIILTHDVVLGGATSVTSE